MTVTVKLFGPFKAGRFAEDIRNCPAGTRVRDIVEGLGLSGPLLGTVLINGVHAALDDLLTDGDILSLLPFIDGG